MDLLFVMVMVTVILVSVAAVTTTPVLIVVQVRDNPQETLTNFFIVCLVLCTASRFCSVLSCWFVFVLCWFLQKHRR